jgi:hypothetical protein
MAIEKVNMAAREAQPRVINIGDVRRVRPDDDT